MVGYRVGSSCQFWRSLQMAKQRYNLYLSNSSNLKEVVSQVQLFFLSVFLYSWAVWRETNPFIASTLQLRCFPSSLLCWQSSYTLLASISIIRKLGDVSYLLYYVISIFDALHTRRNGDISFRFEHSTQMDRSCWTSSGSWNPQSH